MTDQCNEQDSPPSVRLTLILSLGKALIARGTGTCITTCGSESIGVGGSLGGCVGDGGW